MTPLSGNKTWVRLAISWVGFWLALHVANSRCKSIEGFFEPTFIRSGESTYIYTILIFWGAFRIPQKNLAGLPPTKTPPEFGGNVPWEKNTRSQKTVEISAEFQRSGFRSTIACQCGPPSEMHQQTWWLTDHSLFGAQWLGDATQKTILKRVQYQDVYCVYIYIYTHVSKSTYS